MKMGLPVSSSSMRRGKTRMKVKMMSKNLLLVKLTTKPPNLESINSITPSL